MKNIDIKSLIIGAIMFVVGAVGCATLPPEPVQRSPEYDEALRQRFFDLIPKNNP